MIIEKVSVRYGELRSTGFPSFNNKRIEIEYCAQIEDGEKVLAVKNYLLGCAKADVAKEFGDIKDENQIGLNL